MQDRWQWLREQLSGPRAGALLGALLALAILLPLWWQAGRWYQAQLLVEQRSEAALEVSLLGNALSSVINRRLARLQGLSAFVQTELIVSPDFQASRFAPRFDNFAAGIYAGSQGIRNLAVAPEGVMRYVYPLAGNEAVLGYEPLNDPRPDVRADVQRAVESGRIVLSGPNELIQGGLGLIARQAVFQGGRFWGLVNIVLDVPALLDEAGLDRSSGDWDLALRDMEGQVFWVFIGVRDVFASDPVVHHVELPEGGWELAGAPAGGWLATVQRPLRLFQAAGLIIIGLLAGLTYLSINRQARLSRAVRQRTAELQGDIAERVRVEAALREREEQYRSIFEATSDGVFINDLEGFLVDFNPAAARMHGYSPQEFRHLQPAQFIHPDSFAIFAEYIETVKRGDRFQGRAADLRKDGTTFPVEVLGTGFTFRGRPHALAVVRDITEEVQAYGLLEQRVEQRNRELTALLELSYNLGSSLGLEPLLERVLEQLQQVVDYTGATVLILEGEHLRAVGHRGPAPPGVGAHLRFSHESLGPLWADVIKPEPVLINDVRGASPQAQAFRRAVGESFDQEYAFLRTWLGVPLIAQERVIGWLSVEHNQPGAYTSRHVTLALAIAQQAAIAIENARLYERAWRLAALEERQRLARDLHDSVSQALYAIGLNARTARVLLDRDPSQAAGPLDEALSLANAALAEMRALIFELRPDSLEKEGLVAALTKGVAALRARHGLEVHTQFVDEPALSFEAKEALYRISQEALNNAVKHAQARRIDVRLRASDGVVALEVRDDGVGFDPAREYPGHLGLNTMRERADRLGGTLTFESVPGKGTSVRAQIPVPEEK